ncbi:hypothetical protein NUU61_001805 [Penicillium alfredii]|uniref:SAP domain-containing protein n=1 Tax=Penicillium alfredii TaxID=1506179 RepID=A0A9W9KG70_9EURO|nr:uncharacterized protein NUU61_001805 [Penicillium alfredii]KAJ5104458.1 hypothetical protein NUU61_001805 [Penicillium alfredii]
MVDYSSWKVADLKTELKTRGIPQTGLRLKQHFVDKLTEIDATKQPEESVAVVPSVPEPESVEASQQPTSETLPPASEPQPEQQPKEKEQKETPAAPEEEKEVPKDVATPEKAQVPDQPESAGEPTTEPPAQPTPSDHAPQDAAPQVETTAPSAEPVAPAPGDTSAPGKADTIQPTEIPVPSAPQTSEANTELSTPLPAEEALEDRRKRKRRSQSPVPTPEAIANKKARAKDESPQVVLKDEEPPEGHLDEQPADTQKEPRPVPVKQDARFRELFAEPAPPRPASPPKDVAMQDVDVEPALHAATTALYIDGLMRPLQPAALRNHLISVASAPGASPNPTIIQDFYLDPIKTHCFARFADIAAASRARSALHGTVWPNERNRKKLGADFIPDQQLREWIRTEEASRDRPGPAPRWEVRYDFTEDGTTASLVEAGSNSRPAPSRPREPDFNRTPPSGPRGSVHPADRRASNAPPPSRPGQGFKPLDELFESTTTKPKLYYLPVPRRVADKRLDQFDELLRKGTFPRRGGDDTRRITFEDEDYFVDVGPEYGPRALQRRQGQGRGRGGRPGASRRP